MNRILLLSGIMLALLYAGCSSEGERTTVTRTDVTTPASQPTHKTDGPPATGQADAPYDLQFIDTMTKHHEGAIAMAQMAEKKASSPAIKSFAQKIVADQQKEIAQMNKWRQAWYPGKPSADSMEMPGMKDSMQGMDSMKKMATMQGEEFDHHFVDMMIPHHQGAITMAKETVQKAEHPEIRVLANQIIAAQDKEVAMMGEWKQDFHSGEE